jgi:ribosomal protein L7Ae-like RNA K-turn-binding protein
LFARAFKAAATAPENLVETVEAGLEKRALDALGLARRTGDAVLGFDQVKKALAGGRVAVLVSAADAADDGCEKLSRLGARMGKDLPLRRGFTSSALSAAFGKDGVKHAALLKGAAADRFVREAGRLDGFREEAAIIADDE